MNALVGIYFVCGLLAALFLRWDTMMWRKGIGQSSLLSPVENAVCVFYVVGGCFSLAVVVGAVMMQLVQWLLGNADGWNPHAWQLSNPNATLTGGKNLQKESHE